MRWRWPSGFVCPVSQGASQLREDPGALPGAGLSTADIRDHRNDFRGNQGAAVHLVSRHVPPHSEQGRHLQHQSGRRLRRHPDHRLEDQAQAHAGDDGAGRHKAPDGTDRDRRRLSRRGAQRRHAGPRFAWQDADRWQQSKPHRRASQIRLEVAPRKRVPAVPKIATLAQREFRPASARSRRRPALLHWGRATPGCVHQPIITGSGAQGRPETLLSSRSTPPSATSRARSHWHLPHQSATSMYPATSPIRVPLGQQQVRVSPP